MAFPPLLTRAVAPARRCGRPPRHVRSAEFQGGHKVIKAVGDRALAGMITLAALPLLAVIAVAVRIDSPGPVLFRQVRVGLHGREFGLIKFRTMVTGADRQVSDLVERNETDGPLFKIRRDPRVTRVGRVLRRYSLDELPQLCNVLLGQMSLVGPRPPLPGEVARYDGAVARRLLVKPGMTGLWQVSGRSDLSWADGVQLDLHYVENWSLGADLTILWRTVGAVLRGRGAY